MCVCVRGGAAVGKTVKEIHEKKERNEIRKYVSRKIRMLTVEGQSEDVSADRLSSSLSSHQSVHCCCTSHTCHSAVELWKTFRFFQSKKVFFKNPDISEFVEVCLRLRSTDVRPGVDCRPSPPAADTHTSQLSLGNTEILSLRF